MDFNDDVALDAPTLLPSRNNPNVGQASKPAARFPSVGERVAEYEILGEIARGGMGVVYQARQLGLERVVALKMILDSSDDTENSRTRFLNEAKNSAALNHRGIVPVFDIGYWNGYPYFAMAYVEGGSLADKLRDGPVHPDQATRYARQIAEAIQHAHERSIIHRDLKPANILLDANNNDVKITDFGVSKFTGLVSDVTQVGEIVGTPHYMPPEQAGHDSQSVGPASDVYSIGAITYTMLTGRPPFQAATPLDIVAQVLTQPPVRPSTLNPSIPLDLEIITLKCLEKRASDRFQNAGVLVEELKRFESGEPIRTRPPSMFQRARVLIRNHVLLASASGSAVLMLIAVAFLVFVTLYRTRNNLFRVESELVETRELLETERFIARRYLARGVTPEADHVADAKQYEVDRLAQAAVLQFDLHPQRATQLAVASVKLALRENFDLPDEACMVLLQFLDSKGESFEFMEGDDEQYRLIAPDMVGKCEALITEPLTDEDRVLFGVYEGLGDESVLPERKP